MESLLHAELGVDFETGPLITTHMGKMLLTDILVALSEKKNTADVHEAVLYAVELFDVNRENRNKLTHWMQVFVHDDTMYVKRITARRKKKTHIALLPLSEIRRVAEEISEADAYTGGIILHVAGFPWDEPTSPHLSLPPKPNLPTKLEWQSQ